MLPTHRCSNGKALGENSACFRLHQAELRYVQALP